jgi:hypothetical protein
MFNVVNSCCELSNLILEYPKLRARLLQRAHLAITKCIILMHLINIFPRNAEAHFLIILYFGEFLPWIFFCYDRFYKIMSS